MTGSMGAKFKAAGFAALPLVLMFAGCKIWFSDVPVDVYVQGFIMGLLMSLIAVGLVIVYRANRIINFAAADLGSAPATFGFLLFASFGWNLYLSTFIGIGSAVILGIVVEFLFLRRFFEAPRLIMTVATIGVTQLLVALGLFLPIWMGSPDANRGTYQFFDITFRIGETPFGPADALVLMVVPVVLVALGLFLRYSSVGVALRATAENADRASLLGIPVRRLQSVVWGLVALLSFITMFLRIGYAQNLGQVLNPLVLLAALGAAVIGRMERIPTVVLASIGLGIVDRASFFHYNSNASVGTAIIAGIIAIALLCQRADTISRLASSATSTWTATREIKRVPAELRKEKAVRNAYIALGVVIVLFLALIPRLFTEDKIKLSGTIGIYALIGLSLVVLTGWAGQVSLGQMGFVGLSGAVAGTLTTRWHWDVVLVLLVAGLVGAAATVVVGIPTLRARGLAFAVVTLAFSLAMTGYFLNTGYSPIKSWVPNGAIPRTHVFGVISVESETRFYVLVLCVLGLSLFMMRSLRASRIGRVLIGVRDNERAAQAFSVGTTGALVLAFATSGFIAGMAGGLFVLQQRALDANNFNPTEGLAVFSMVVVGGLGSIGGSILGAVFIKGTQYFLTQPQWAILSTGAGMLLILLLMPGGLGAAVGDLRDGILRWYAKRKGIRVPSLLADTRVEELPQVDVEEVLTSAAENAADLAEIRD
jgi:branched-chain amino acid transport system permease protein